MVQWLFLFWLMIIIMNHSTLIWGQNTIIITISLFSELLVDITLIELPSPKHQNRRHKAPKQSRQSDYDKSQSIAFNAFASQVLSVLPREPLSLQLPQTLLVVQPTGDEDVQYVDADRARHAAEAVQRGVVFEAEDLRDDREDQRPLRAEAEADDHGGEVEAVGDAERDKEVADAGE